MKTTENGRTTAYQANASEPCVAGTPGTTREHTFFILDGWNVIAEYAQSGATGPVAKGGASGPVAAVPSATDRQASGLPHLSARHLWGEDLSRSLQGAGGIGGLLMSTFFHPSPTTANNRQPPQTQPQTHFFSYDSNGNVMLLTDPACVPSASYRCDSFGRVTKAAGAAAALNRYQFSTKPVERESELSYYGFRYYSANFRTWISPDPIEYLLVGDAERRFMAPSRHTTAKIISATQQFQFGYNDPVNRVDVLGTVAPAVAAVTAAGACLMPHFLAGLYKYQDDEQQRHCWTTCMASRLCGSVTALVAGIGFEVFTYVFGDDNLANHIYDLANNSIGMECAGIECVIPLVGTVTRWFRESCEECCEDILL